MSIKATIGKFLFSKEFDEVKKEYEILRSELQIEYRKKFEEQQIELEKKNALISKKLDEKKQAIINELSKREAAIEKFYQSMSAKLENERKEFEEYKQRENDTLKQKISQAQNTVRELYEERKIEFQKSFQRILANNLEAAAKEIFARLIHLRPELSGLAPNLQDILKKQIAMVLDEYQKGIVKKDELEAVITPESWARSIPDFREEPNQ